MTFITPTKLYATKAIWVMACFLTSFTLMAQGTMSVSLNGGTVQNGDNIDFGSTSEGSTISNTFVLDNIANGGNPKNRLNNISVQITGSTDFSPPFTNLGSLKGSDNPINYVITFNPSSAGLKTATVTINFTDGNPDGPYIFTIQGTGTQAEPEIDVTDSGDNSLSIGANFDFGTIQPGTMSSEAFSIKNLGSGSTILNLTGNPLVSISGNTEFSVTTQPASNSISGGNSRTFIIEYNPLTLGSHSAIVSILNDDSNEGNYQFTVSGTAADVSYVPITSGPDWTVTNLTSNSTLNGPNTIIYGPDNFLWITERVGEQVVKVDPISGGSKTTILDLSSQVYRTGGQDGLMGMAVHPALYADVQTTVDNYVYLAYTYSINGSDSGRRLRIARFTYDHVTGTLNSGSETTILEGMDASNDHNSGKLIFGPDDKLYYSIGDLGANQFANACNEIQAQTLPTIDDQTATGGDKSAYKGKILRMELDGSIPIDNPVLGGFRTHVYSYGHRNAQGIVFAADGKLYSSEHGPKVDDELNLIVFGGNYGWPAIAGYYDNAAYEYCNWSLSTSCGSFSNDFCPGDVTPIPENDPSNASIAAILQQPIGTYNSTATMDPSGGFLEWPTVAPAGIDIYEAGLIPDWGKSLLIPTLKRGTIFRAKLDPTGNALESQVYEEFHSSNDRYRDICMGPDGVTIYAITDSSGSTSGPSGTNPQTLQNPGVVMRIQYKCLIGATCDDGDECTTNDIYDSACNCIGTPEPDSDGDGVCDSQDQCPGTDDNVIGNSCDDGDPCTINDVYVINTSSCDCEGTDTGDSDFDGVCDALDQCPGEDDTIDLNGNQIPDCLENGCQDATTSLSPSPLTHSQGGSSSASVSFPANSQDVEFTISGINAQQGGKPSNRYIERVVVRYVNGSGQTITQGTYLGTGSSNVFVSILDAVQSVTVILDDAYNGNTDSTMSINFSIVDYCVTSSGAKIVNTKVKSSSTNSISNLTLYPNPFSSELTIERAGTDVSKKLYLYNVTGQLISTTVLSGNKQTINLVNIPSGLYLARFVDGNENITAMKRLVKE